MNWTGAPAMHEPLPFRALMRHSRRRYTRVDEWRGFHPRNFGLWARALAFRIEQKLRDQHTCERAMSSLRCRACNRGVPYPHPQGMDEVLAVLQGKPL